MNTRDSRRDSRAMGAVGAALVLLLLLASPAAATPQEPQTLTPEEAADHIGEEAKVCGDVVATDHVPTLEGEPSFLNFGGAYPDQVFTVAVFAENAGKFKRPPHRLFRNKSLCATGTIVMVEGKPRIVVSEPDAIEVVGDESRRR